MKRVILMLILLTSLHVSYSQGSKNSSSIKLQVFPRHEPYTLYAIVEAIADYETVNTEYVGYSGGTSEQWELFLKLMRRASDTFLIALTNSNNPNLKAYAFLGLALRGNSITKEIALAHLQDTSKFILFSDCVKTPESIRSWFLYYMYYNAAEEEKRRFARIYPFPTFFKLGELLDKPLIRCTIPVILF